MFYHIHTIMYLIHVIEIQHSFKFGVEANHSYFYRGLGPAMHIKTNIGRINKYNYLELAVSTGIEPATNGSLVECSDQQCFGLSAQDCTSYLFPSHFMLLQYVMCSLNNFLQMFICNVMVRWWLYPIPNWPIISHVFINSSPFRTLKGIILL